MSTVVTPARPAGPASSGRSAVAPRAASSPAPPSVVPLPPRPDHDLAGPGVDRGERPARRRRGSRPPRRAPCGSGAVRRPGRSRRTPFDPASSTVAGVGSPKGPATVVASTSPPSASWSTSTKPGPPSAIGARSSSSSGACRRQPVGDRLGGLDGGQRAGELVGGHQHAHGRHLVSRANQAHHQQAGARRGRRRRGRGCRAARSRSTPPTPPPRPGPVGSTSASALLRGMWKPPVMRMLARKASAAGDHQRRRVDSARRSRAPSTVVPTITSTRGARGADRLICCMASTAERVGVRSRRVHDEGGEGVHGPAERRGAQGGEDGEGRR